MHLRAIDIKGVSKMLQSRNIEDDVFLSVLMKIQDICNKTLGDNHYLLQRRWSVLGFCFVSLLKHCLPHPSCKEIGGIVLVIFG